MSLVLRPSVSASGLTYRTRPRGGGGRCKTRGRKGLVHDQRAKGVRTRPGEGRGKYKTRGERGRYATRERKV